MQESNQPKDARPSSPAPSNGQLANEIRFLQEVQSRLQTPGSYATFLGTLKLHKESKISTKDLLVRVNTIFGKESDLFVKFKMFLSPAAKKAAGIEVPPTPPTLSVSAPRPVAPSTSSRDITAPNLSASGSTPAPPMQAAPKAQVDTEFQLSAQKFVTTIRTLYSDRPQVYHAFLEMLKRYSSKEVTFAEVSKKVAELFHDHPQLIAQFGSFLDRDRANTLKKASDSKKSTQEAPKARAVAAAKPPAPPVASRMGGPRGRSVLSVRQEEEEDEPANGRASLMRSGPKLNLTKNRGLRSVNDDEIELYDLNLDACERVGPSYVKVPSNVRLQKCSGKDSIGAKVLNDHLVCTPSGAEGSFKDSAKNPHEETLFKVEDDQLEMDMLIGKFTSLIAALKKLQEALLKGTWRRDDPEQIYVTGSHAYALRVMFKEEYLDTLKQLKQDPARIVDSVLEKVQCKCDNLVTGRWRWRMIWRAVQRKSSMSSLDVQGHVYRTDDKIKTHPKQLIALLREQYFDSVKQGKITDFHLSYQLSKQTPEFFEDMVRLVGTAGATIIQNPPELKMVMNFVKSTLRKLFGTAEVTPSSGLRSRAVLYGNITLYTIVMLVKIILERLSIAKELSSYDSTRWDYGKRPVPLPTPESQWETPAVREVELNGAKQQDQPTIVPVNTPAASEKNGSPEASEAPEPKSNAYPQSSSPPMNAFDEDAPNGNGNGSGNGNSENDNENSSESGHDDDDNSENGGSFVTILGMESEGGSYQDGTFVPSALLSDVHPATNVAPDEKYAYFLKSIEGIYSTEVKELQLEKQCLVLFGLQGFQLITLHEVVLHLVRQIKVFVSASESNKIISAFDGYWTKRQMIPIDAKEAISSLEDQYFKASKDLFASLGHRCIKMEYNPLIAQLWILMLLNTEDLNSVSEKERWLSYLRGFICGEDVKLDPRRHHIFLARNLEKTKQFQQNFVSGQSNLLYKPDLECLISPQNYRMVYVEQTEDLMYRSKQNPKKRLREESSDGKTATGTRALANSNGQRLNTLFGNISKLAKTE